MICTTHRIIVLGTVTEDFNIALVPRRERDATIQNISSRAGGALLLQTILHELVSHNTKVLGHYPSRKNQQKARKVDFSKLGRPWYSETETGAARRRDALDESLRSVRVQVRNYMHFQLQPRHTGDYLTESDQILRELRFDFVNDWEKRDKQSKASRAKARSAKALEVKRSSWRMSQVLATSRTPQTSSRVADKIECKYPVPKRGDVVVVEDEEPDSKRRDSDPVWLDACHKVTGENILLYKHRFRGKNPTVDCLATLARAGCSLISFVRASDLRDSGLGISRGISWERTCGDLLGYLADRPANTPARKTFRELCRNSVVVVSFGTAGVLVISPRSRGGAGRSQRDCFKTALVFDEWRQEGAWDEEYPGQLYGVNAVIASTIVRELARLKSPLKSVFKRVVQGAKIGLGAARYMSVAGFSDDLPLDDTDGVTRTTLGIPLDQLGVLLDGARNRQPRSRRCKRCSKRNGCSKCVDVCRKCTTSCKRFHSHTRKYVKRFRDYISSLTVVGIPLQSNASDYDDWTLLEHSTSRNRENTARRVAMEGVGALTGVPKVQLGDLTIVDRREIEAFTAIRSLLEIYLDSNATRPISFAVFGPPGSGKSFGIRQLAESLSSGPTRLDTVEFDLSQLNAPSDLFQAFHVVRDRAFENKVPLVFWDEFDSTVNAELFWPKFFLAPMQEGRFRQGGFVHPIGRAVFAFIGGTCHSFRDFVARHGSKRDQKVPDFLSRLRGHINVLGANPGPGRKLGDRRDLSYLRRAHFLHHALRKSGFDGFSAGSSNISPGVLDAFLFAEDYRHGARSLEAIVQMSKVRGATVFGPSNLPMPEQLEGHVDAVKFIRTIHLERSE